MKRFNFQLWLRPIFNSTFNFQLMAACFAAVCVMLAGCEKTDSPEKEVPVEKVTINQPAAGAELVAGVGTLTLSVTIEPANATDKSPRSAAFVMPSKNITEFQIRQKKSGNAIAAQHRGNFPFSI
jgi:hypothetical protein